MAMLRVCGREGSAMRAYSTRQIIQTKMVNGQLDVAAGDHDRCATRRRRWNSLPSSVLFALDARGFFMRRPEAHVSCS